MKRSTNTKEPSKKFKSSTNNNENDSSKLELEESSFGIDNVIVEEIEENMKADQKSDETDIKTIKSYFTIDAVEDAEEKNTKIGNCKLCKQKIKMKHANTTGLIRHLKSKHVSEYSKIYEHKKHKGQMEMTAFLNKPRNEKIERTSKEQIEQNLVNWAICKYLPFNFFDDEETINLFKQINPNITVPKRGVLKDKILNKFKEMQQKIKLKLGKISSKFSFTIDGWTSINNKSFYGITIHFIDEQFNLHSMVLDFVPSQGNHTGKAIAELFFNTVKFYEIEHKIQGITVDNAAANSIFMCKLEAILKPLGIAFNSSSQHFKCFAHMLNLGVQDALRVLKFDNDDSQDSNNSDDESDESEESGYTCIDKLRYILRKIKNSEQLDLKLQSACHSTDCVYLKPILDVRTRWNSTSDMLDRALLMKSALNTLCENNKFLLKYKLKTEEWDILNHLCKFLKHFKVVSLVLGGDKYVTLPTVVVAFNLLLDKIDTQIARSALSTSEANNIFVAALHAAKSKLLKHYHKTNWIYCAVLILDPRHKLETFSMTTWGKEMMNYSYSTFKEIYKTKYYSNSNTESSTLSSSSEASSSDDVVDINILYDTTGPATSTDTQEIDEYLAVKRANKDENVLKFWYKHQELYPNLANMARDFFSTPATSVPSERLFSQAGLLLRKHRNRLNEESARSMLCLKSWLTSKFLDL